MNKISTVSFVTPRYGLEVIGGAEYAARMMAENLVSRLGLKVEILTTTSLDTDSWDNHYSAGSEVINEVNVKRFTVDRGRSSNFSNLSRRLLNAPGAASLEESQRWIEAQGPISHSLLAAIENCESDAILFYPYLYHPMVASVVKVRDRAIMVPAAHDEPPAYLPVFQHVFQAARGMIFHSKAEEQLVDKVFRVANKPRVLSGLGIDDHRDAFTPLGDLFPSLAGNPFILALGRTDQLKGSTLLSELFAEYKRRNPSRLKLVFAGPVTTQPLDYPDIVTLGRIDDTLKWSLLNECIALVNPSGFEAFSIVIFEAWSRERPVMVNSQCQVTKDHVEDSGGGLAFSDFAEFEAELNMIFSQPELRRALGSRGKRYLDDNYRWEVVAEKIGKFLNKTLKA